MVPADHGTFVGSGNMFIKGFKENVSLFFDIVKLFYLFHLNGHY